MEHVATPVGWENAPAWFSLAATNTALPTQLVATNADVPALIADIDTELAVSTPEFLTPHDFVGVTFWIISMAMVGSTVFFLMESQNLKGHWKTSLNVGALVVLIAAVHYFYMRSYWVGKNQSQKDQSKHLWNLNFQR